MVNRFLIFKILKIKEPRSCEAGLQVGLCSDENLTAAITRFPAGCLFKRGHLHKGPLRGPQIRRPHAGANPVCPPYSEPRIPLDVSSDPQLSVFRSGYLNPCWA